jgi:hypothetical protein
MFDALPIQRMLSLRKLKLRCVDAWEWFQGSADGVRAGPPDQCQNNCGKGAPQSADTASDPMKQLSKTFPDTVAIKNKGRLLEFCPDGTCDGFVTSGNMSVPTLREFAYLYVYFFSDFTFLDE